jgi:hypothetical protein
MFFKSYLFVFLLSAFTANAAVIAVRKQDEATTNLQMNKLKDSGLLDKLNKDNLMNQIKTMNANSVLAKIVQTDKFKELKTTADKKAGRKTNAKQSNTDKAKSTGILDKLNEWKGGSTQDKLNKMDGKTLLIKIAQSKAFKTWFDKQRADRKAQEEKVKSDMKKGKRPTIVKIVHKNKGKPTATVISIKGGPAITLAAKGVKTSFAGKGYTVSPTAGAAAATKTGKDNGAAGLSVSGSLMAKFLAVAGGIYGGVMLVL